MKTLHAAIVVGTVCCATCAQKPADENEQPASVQFIFGIGRDGSLTLDGARVTSEELAKEWPRLAKQVREKAEAAGEKRGLERELPATVIVWSDDSVKCSHMLELLGEAQKSGFVSWQFIRKSVVPDPAQIDPPGPQTVRQKPSELPAFLRTVPIVLSADKNGDIGKVTLGEIELEGFDALRTELCKITDDPDVHFDAALIRLSPTLKYVELTRVTGLLLESKIRKLSFAFTAAKADD